MTLPKPQHQDSWTFLSNYSHVLLCLAQDPELTLREVSLLVGITERSVQRIIADLEDSGVIEKRKTGVRNSYVLNRKAKLRHPLEAHCTVGDLVDMVQRRKARR